MKKRLWQLLLTIALVGLIVFPVSVFAITREDAVNWAKNQEGGGRDVDGNGLWCTDLATAYINYCWLRTNGDNNTNPWGLYPYTTRNAKDYDNYLNGNPNWTIINRTGETIPQPGDLFVSEKDSTGMGVGHVGVILEVYGSSRAKIIEMSGGVRPKINTVTWGSTASYNADHFIRFNYFENPYVNLGNDFYAFIIRMDSWKHLAAEHGNVVLATNGNNSVDPKQIWHFVRQSNGTYRISNEYDERCLDASDFGTNNGTNVGVHESNDSTAQRWIIYNEGNAYSLAPSYCNLRLDVENGSNDPGSNIQLYERNGTAAQIFSIYYLSNDGVTYSKPSRPAAVTPNISVSGKKVTITWNESPKVNAFDNRVYDIRIFKDNPNNEAIFAKFDITDRKYEYAANQSGTYYVTIASVNSKYYEWYSFSSVKSFQIKDEHSHSLEFTAAKSATCSAGGNSAYWYCSSCGKFFSDSAGKTEINKDSWNIPAKGHTPMAVAGKVATCTDSGLTEGSKCSVCGAVIKAQEVIPAIGHSWDGGTVVREATTTSTGLKRYTCRNCGKTRDEEIPKIIVTTVAATGIQLDKASISLIKGESGTITATISPSNTTDKTVTWSSSNSSVAIVNNGTVSAVSAGTADIIAKTSNGLTASCKCTVKEPTVMPSSIQLDSASMTLTTGESKTINATISPSNTTDKTVTWSSSNSSVATVNNGTVSAVSAGTADIIAKTSNGLTASCKCTVKEPTVMPSSILLDTASMTLTTGESRTINATISPSNTTDKTVTWSSSNSNVATVNNGKVSAVSAGTADIIAKTANGLTASCKCTVKDPEKPPVVPPVPSSSVSIFVTRLYENFLQRQPDTVGLANWVDALQSGNETGANVVKGFVLSPEYMSRPLSNRDYVTALYRVIFSREPDSSGLNAWVSILENGCTNKKVLSGFVNSDEFRNLCADMGIRAGSYTSNEVADINSKVSAFVARLYKVCLGRQYEQDGLNDWVNGLLSKRLTGSSVARGFFNSDEFKNRKLNDRDFVTVAYRTLLNREPDNDGLDSWVAALENKSSRADVVNGFTKSVEFGNLCAEYGITR